MHVRKLSTLDRSRPSIKMTSTAAVDQWDSSGNYAIVNQDKKRTRRKGKTAQRKSQENLKKYA
jgi:hypothetical protein